MASYCSSTQVVEKNKTKGSLMPRLTLLAIAPMRTLDEEDGPDTVNETTTSNAAPYIKIKIDNSELYS